MRQNEQKIEKSKLIDLYVIEPYTTVIQMDLKTQLQFMLLVLLLLKYENNYQIAAQAQGEFNFNTIQIYEEKKNKK